MAIITNDKKIPHKEYDKNTDFFIFTSIVTLLIFLLFPFLYSLYIIINCFYYENDYQRGFLTLSGCILMLLPIYYTTRYAPGLFNAILRTLRNFVAPYIMIYGWIPREYDDEYKIKVMLIVLTLKTLLGIFRALCKPPAYYDSRRRLLSNPDPNDIESESDMGDKDITMRVLIAGDSFPPKVDGVATFAVETVDFLQSFGHIVHVITSIKGPLRIKGARVTRLPGVPTSKSPGHSVTIPLPTALLTILKFKPHVVHIFEVSPFALAMMFYCQIADVPCSFSHHTRIDLYCNLVTPNFPTWLNEGLLALLELTFYPLVDSHPCVCTILCDRVKRFGNLLLLLLFIKLIYFN